jgi:cytochrome b561
MRRARTSVQPAPEAYPRARQLLHWVSAALILLMVPTGLLMARTLDDALRLNLYQVHLLAGWTIVALMVVRVVLRVRRPVAAPAGLAPWNARLYLAVHWAVTLLPLLLAASGMGVILQNDLGPLLQARTPPPATLDVVQARDLHERGAYLFMALLLVHVAGVVRYQRASGDVLARMGLRGLPSGGGGRRA